MVNPMRVWWSTHDIPRGQNGTPAAFVINRHAMPKTNPKTVVMRTLDHLTITTPPYYGMLVVCPYPKPLSIGYNVHITYFILVLGQYSKKEADLQFVGEAKMVSIKARIGKQDRGILGQLTYLKWLGSTIHSIRLI